MLVIWGATVAYTLEPCTHDFNACDASPPWFVGGDTALWKEAKCRVVSSDVFFTRWTDVSATRPGPRLPARSPRSPRDT